MNAPDDTRVATAAVVDPSRQEAERCLGGPLEAADENHAAIVVAILDELRIRGLAVDAAGSFRDRASWCRVDAEPAALGREIAFKLRSAGVPKIESCRVTETLEVMSVRDARARRAEIYARHIGKPASARGEAELRRWLRAVAGVEREHDVQAMRHWIHQVKNRVSGRPGDLHMMPVVYGQRQGSGKSVAVGKLCAVWAELFNADFASEDITDERRAPALGRIVVACWDELGGLGRADLEKLKHRLTGSTISYRPMTTNTVKELPMLVSLIGTSNRRLVDLAKDPTGARRFFEIEAADVIDWQTINDIDYDQLWQAVNEDEEAPGRVHRELIAAEQMKLVWRDPVERWLTDEDEAGWSVVAGLDGQDLGSAKPDEGIASAKLYDRFRRWCADAGEREVTREVMGRRLSDLGWDQFRLPRSLGHGKAYRRVSQRMKDAVFTVFNRVQSPPDGPSEHAEHGDPRRLRGADRR
jgi:Virulence-associated protein E